MSSLHMFVEKTYVCNSDEEEAAIINETNH